MSQITIQSTITGEVAVYVIQDDGQKAVACFGHHMIRRIAASMLNAADRVEASNGELG